MPNTIAENLQRLIDAKENIADAITAKGGTVGANDGLEEFAADIATIPSGGGGTSQPRKDVNFYDYDGTIVNSYTAAEFAELSAMPSNPTHEGLTAQGWNWSLSDAKTYVANYGKLEIGQMYITSDGKTRLYITLTEGRLTPYLKLYLNASSELDIDWGDGSSHSTFTNTSSGPDYISEMHTYASTGSYVIAITVISGGFIFLSTTSQYSSIISDNYNGVSSPNLGYANSLTKVEIGAGCASINRGAFVRCYSLKSITIPNSVSEIRNCSFGYCYSLKSITIPSSVTSIGTQLFDYCTILKVVAIPNSLTSIGGYTFRGCSTITLITIPSSVTSIDLYSFYECSSLTAITIPSSVTSIDSTTFKNCYSLSTITIDKPEGSISGSPWGATTSAPTSTQIIWTG